MRAIFLIITSLLFFTLTLAPNTSDATEHKVKSGDTLYSLALKYGSTVNKLRQVNNLSSDSLKLGQILLIPQSLSTLNSTSETEINIEAPASDKKELNIKKSITDTNAEIKKEKITSSTKTIEVYNFVTEKTAAEKTSESTYFVKSGDTIGQIAEKLGVTSTDLKSINGLKGSKIKIGQRLKVPGIYNTKTETVAVRTTSDKYTVRKGDTLSQIAKRHGVSVINLKAYNGINSNNIIVGKNLRIPDQSYTAPPQIKTAEYKVRSGDTLSSISVKFGTNISTIRSLNNLNSNFLKTGETLTVPEGRATKGYAKNTVNYTVRNGDTLSTIARKFDVSVSEVKSLNSLSSSFIKKGQKIKIPSDGLSSETVSKEISHKVRKGESLYSISRKYGTSVSEIKNANNISGTKIAVNQTIKIPTEDKIYLKSETRSRYTSSKSKSSSGSNQKVSDNLIQVAKKYLGAPYKFGGNSTKTGIDCSAYVKKVYSFFDVSLPRTARDIFKKGDWVKKNSLEKGDLVFFRTYAHFPSHVGIYIGDNKFIHASSASKKVTITNFNKNYYQKRYIGAKRIPIKGAFFDNISDTL